MSSRWQYFPCGCRLLHCKRCSFETHWTCFNINLYIFTTTGVQPLQMLIGMSLYEKLRFIISLHKKLSSHKDAFLICNFVKGLLFPLSKCSQCKSLSNNSIRLFILQPPAQNSSEKHHHAIRALFPACIWCLPGSDSWRSCNKDACGKDCPAFKETIKISKCSINAKAISVPIFLRYFNATCPSFYVSPGPDWYFNCSPVEHESKCWFAKISFEHSVISLQTQPLLSKAPLNYHVQYSRLGGIQHRA